MSKKINFTCCNYCVYCNNGIFDTQKNGCNKTTPKFTKPTVEAPLQNENDCYGCYKKKEPTN